MPTDTPFEQRIRTIYAVSVPTELDRRIHAAMTTVPVRRSGRLRPRMIAALAVAAIFVTTAAGPAIQWFESWYGPFDRLWKISTPVDQTVTADGYRVTVHRAYADRLGVRLAMTVDDLDDRWSEFYVEAAEATAADGRVFDAWNGPSRTPFEGSTATWARFLVPADALGDKRQLRVTVTSLAVRSPEPIPSDPDPERIWTTVEGEWTFELDVPPVTAGKSVSPAATATANGVTINLRELGVVPSGTVVRLAVDGLPDVPTLYGWLPSSTIEHDGKALSDQPFEPGVVGSDGVVTIEALPDEAPFDVEGLAGHWRITVDTFYAFDPTTEQGHELHGPWVLEFDVAETP